MDETLCPIGEVTNDNLRFGSAVDPLVSLGYCCLVRFAQALCVFGYHGTFGVGIDVDHIPYYLSQFLPQVYGGFADLPARFAHRFIFYGLFVVLCGLAAYVIGRLAQIIRSV